MRQRLAAIAIVAGALVAAGGTCVPLVDLDARQPREEARTLGVSVTSPSTDRAVTQGLVVRIEWTAFNQTGSEAIATLLVRSREDLSDTILSGGIRIEGQSATQSFDWDTTDFAPAQYLIRVRVEAGEETSEAEAGGEVTVDEPPTFEFDEPLIDTTLIFTDEDDESSDEEDPGTNLGEAENELRIGWVSVDRDGTASADIGLDVDEDHESGNEIIITNTPLSTDGDVDSFNFDGTDADGVDVQPATYFLYARITDPVNPDQIVQSPARITVGERPDSAEPGTPEITEPEEDTELLTGGDPVTITYTLDEPEDILLDIKIDTDDNRRNGNELTILSQMLVESDVDEDTFEWEGSVVAGGPAPEGIYRVFLVVNREEGAPELADAPALIFLRSSDEQPLIALLAPDQDITVAGGDFVTIRWRDEDPGEDATIRLTIDDDPDPDELVETDEPELQILVGRDAAADGVQDTFNYQLPNNLEPGLYYIFAYIDKDGAPPWDQVNASAGRLIIEDPTAP